MTGISAYVSRLLRKRLGAHGQRASPGEVDGVVLFADIVGSTALTDRIATAAPDGAEQLGGMLNRYFANVIDVVTRYGGDVIRVDGDAVIALWQQGDAGETAALHAAQAAIALRDGLSQWRIDPGWQVQHRLTLAAGRLTTTILPCAGCRHFFILAGAPLRTVGAISHDGEPGEIVLDATLATMLVPHAVLEPSDEGPVRLLAVRDAAMPDAAPSQADDDTAAVEPFVPRIVVERSRSGHADWLAEFRTLSMVYIRMAATLQSADRLQPILDAIAQATRSLEVEIYDVVADDKGIIAKIACGLPPLSQESNASRALEIAQRIRAGLAGMGIACPIGVATGRAFCGEVGSLSRREYLLTGPAMNYGARLMQTGDDDILCDQATHQAALARFAFDGPMLISIKGRTEPLPVYRVVGENVEAALPTGSGVRLHGRDEELRQLVDCLRLLPQSGLIAIEAEPGAGKSRLLMEFSNAARHSGCTVVHAATHAIEQTTAWYVFRVILRALLARPDDLPQVPLPLLRQRLEAALAGGPLTERAPLLEDILPFGFAETQISAEITGAARLAGIEELIVALTVRQTGDRPLVLLIDDLHWIDELSAQLLLALSRRVPGLLIALASRPRALTASPYVARLLDAASLHLPLTRLSGKSIAGIISEVLGVGSVPRRLADFVRHHSEGLPLHAEQLTLSLRERDMIAVTDGRCRVLAADLGAGPVPDNLRDLIVSRIDSLQQAEQFAAKVASAIGRVFDIEALRAVHPVAADLTGLDTMLERLAAAGILLIEPESPSGTYAFRHGLIQEATYDLLSFGHRRLFHRRIAEFLERRHVDELPPHFAELAEHWERAEDQERTIDYRLRAASLALRRYANDDALMHLERAERLAEHAHLVLPTVQRAEVARIRGEALHALSRFADARDQFLLCAKLNGIRVPSNRLALIGATGGELARQVLHRCGFLRPPANQNVRDRDRLAAHLHTRLAEHAYFMSDTLAIAHGTLNALNRAERVLAVSETVEGLGAFAIGLGAAGRHGLARFYRDRSVRLATGEGGMQDRGLAHLFAAVYLFSAGAWPDAVTHTTAGAAIYQQLGDRFRYQSCCVVGAYTNIMRGDYSKAVAQLLAFGSEAEQVENLPVRAWVLCGLAILDMIQGRAPGLALARISLARDTSLHRGERLLCDGLEAAAHLHADNLPEARRCADAALKNLLEASATLGIALFSVCAMAAVQVVMAADSADGGLLIGADHRRARTACRIMRSYATRTRICQPGALRVAGYFALSRGRTVRAAVLWRKALRDADRMELPLESALCHLALAEVGDDDAARETHRDAGVALLDRLGARPWRYPLPIAWAQRPQNWMAIATP